MQVPYLKQLYREKVVPELKKERGYSNPHQVPALDKIVVNSRIKAESDKAFVQEVVKEIGLITGQKPVIARAKMAVANFKVRENMPVGVRVTLRGNQMWDFLLRLVAVTLPNIRDFRGVSRKLDGQGNYSLGIADNTIFPEVTMDPGRKNIGLDVTIVTTAETDDEGRDLLRLLGMPFRVSTPQSQPVQKKPGEPAPAEAAPAAQPAPVPATA